MNKIRLLDSHTANRIAAGEVVERPSSVVKELVENALDAGASIITVEIKQGGIRMIRVVDNGQGLSKEDAYLAFERHATSKLSSIDDLEELLTMGFRGEALASIAAVAQITLTTRQAGDDQGLELCVEAGKIVTENISSGPVGTIVEVENLFYNTPARYKFLKRDQTEASYVTDLIERMSLARPDVSFRLYHQDRELIHTPGNNDLLSSIYAVYGQETAQACLPLQFIESPVKITGFVTSPAVSRHNRNRQNVIVNGRLISARVITAALDEAIKTWFMKGRYPTVVLNLSIPIPLVDVNVHPQKTEVRFWDDRQVFHCVYHALRQALTEHSGIEAANDIDKDSLAAKRDQGKTILPNAADKPDKLDKKEDIATEIIKDEEAQISFSELATPEIGTALSADTTTSHTVAPEAATTSALDSKEALNTAEGEENTVTNIRKKINSLQNARIIGQLFLTYLLLECENELFLVDQHAAHERILYERLQEQSSAGAKNNNRQPLLIPEPIGVSSSEKQIAIAASGYFNKLGFEFDDFGPDTLLIRSIPAGTEKLINATAAFRVILDQLLEGHAKTMLPTADDAKAMLKENDIFAGIACKAAVKANDLLHVSEMQRLLADLQILKNPYHCPHGRPVIIRFSKYELEKKFKRIV